MNPILKASVILVMIVYSTLTAYIWIVTSVSQVQSQPTQGSPGATTNSKMQKPSGTPDVIAKDEPAPSLISASDPTTVSTARDFFAETPSHSSPSDCWMIISSHVYDVTNYFGMHPGGDGALAKYCGKDATVAFNTKDRSPGGPHSSQAESLLAQFLIK